MAEPSVSSTTRLSIELGPVTHVTLDRPTLANALDVETGRELEAAVRVIAQHAETRVVVLRGAGDHFCAGGDFTFIEENTRLGRAEVEARMLSFYRSFLSVLELPVPTIAQIQGSAIGAGLCLALACDLRVAGTSARLAANFVRLGLHPGMGASVLLAGVVGPARANELLLTGRSVSAERAEALGLVTATYPDAALARETERLASDIAAQPALALRQTVETVRRPLLRQLRAALAREAACQAEDFGTPEVRQAVLAFRRDRAPR